MMINTPDKKSWFFGNQSIKNGEKWWLDFQGCLKITTQQLFEEFPQHLGNKGFIQLARWLLSHLCCRSCRSLCSLQTTTQTRFHASAGSHFCHLPEEFYSILHQHLWRTSGIHVVDRGGSLYQGRTCLRLRGEKMVLPAKRGSKRPAETEHASAGQQPGSHRKLSRSQAGPSHLCDLHHGKATCNAPRSVACDGWHRGCGQFNKCSDFVFNYGA